MEWEVQWCRDRGHIQGFMFTAWELSHQTRMPNGSDRPKAEPLQADVDRNESVGLWLGNGYCCAPVIHTTTITFRFTQITREEVLVKPAKTTITESVEMFSELLWLLHRCVFMMCLHIHPLRLWHFQECGLYSMKWIPLKSISGACHLHHVFRQKLSAIFSKSSRHWRRQFTMLL